MLLGFCQYAFISLSVLMADIPAYENPSFFLNPIIMNNAEMLSATSYLRKKKISTPLTQQERLFSIFFERDDEHFITIVGDKLVLKLPKSGFLLTRKENVVDYSLKVYNKTIAEIKKKIGISPPSGYYYCWFVTDRSRFTEFGDYEPEVAGVTIFARYIIMPFNQFDNSQVIKNLLVNQGNLLPEMRIQAYGTFETTFSHELIHAIFNSYIAYPNINKMPVWWDEAVAINLSLGSKRFLTSEYKGYQRLFDYIVQRYGAEMLYKYIRLSADMAEADKPLLMLFNLNGYRGLNDASLDWEKKKNRVTWVIIAFYLAFMVSMMGFYPLRYGMIAMLVALLLTIGYIALLMNYPILKTHRIDISQIIILLIGGIVIYLIPVKYLIKDFKGEIPEDEYLPDEEEHQGEVIEFKKEDIDER